MKRAALFLMILFLLPVEALAVKLDEPDVILAQPNDSGYDVEAVLDLCAGLGYLKNAPANLETYLPEYKDSVTAMEEALGLTPDGIIYLSEYLEFEGLMYEGITDQKVKKLQEKLHDLGYLTGKLPDQHDTWDNKLTAAVKRAEKALNLKADGLLTDSELTAILNVRITLPQVKNLKLTTSGGKVTVSWSAAKDADRYEVCRDGRVVATVSGKTTWQDTGVEMGIGYEYKVRAVKYTVSGLYSTSEWIYVKPVYKTMTLKQIYDDRKANDGTFVRINSSKVVSARTEGNNYRITITSTVDKQTYRVELLLLDFKDWGWRGKPISQYNIKTVNGTGQITNTSSYIPVITMDSIDFTY